MEIFGTDGVRGLAGAELTPLLAYRLGRAGAHVLRRKTAAGAPGAGVKPVVYVGRDTRLSGPMLEAALCAGICSAGVDAVCAGVVPTPGVACLARRREALAGVVISASHNPYQDNGIKFFAAGGCKLPDEWEAEIAAALPETESLPAAVGRDIGRIETAPELVGVYRDFLLADAPDLTGWKIVVDCANGAASHIAPPLLQTLGAEVEPIFCQPNGVNINDGCGSTCPQTLAAAVRRLGADAGLAFDGDADRLIAVDEEGRILDGDHIMTICALARQRPLPGDAVVVTVMSNIGLYRALRAAGLTVHWTQVGDRCVMERITATGAALGGEQSGHIIFPRRHTTGDGIFTALELLRVMRRTRRPLSVLGAQMEQFPQILLNTPAANKEAALSAPEVLARIRAAEERLGEDGRVLVRPSGTEPLIRVMLEGRDEGELRRLGQSIVEAVAAVAGRTA
ncbi:MAG: phosphoglucosamine mutase [Gracilibacteraceae bacterium]|nr:phosphoglucosamine mutase [Gracilibacteraceae bacterium]